LDTISFTLYALLPTLSPQLTSAYPVEETSGLLQGISNPSSSVASIGATPDTTPANSLLLQGEQEVSIREDEPSSASPPVSGTSGISTLVSGPTSAVGESWASEFQNQSQEQSPDQNRNQDLPARESLEGSEAFSLAHAEGDDGVSVALYSTHHACHRTSPETDLAAVVSLSTGLIG
jgi:peroxin-3